MPRADTLIHPRHGRRVRRVAVGILAAAIAATATPAPSRGTERLASAPAATGAATVALVPAGPSAAREAAVPLPGIVRIGPLALRPDQVASVAGPRARRDRAAVLARLRATVPLQCAPLTDDDLLALLPQLVAQADRPRVSSPPLLAAQPAARPDGAAQ
jgi:hypothetical protein